jgi:hypothetical protein
MGVRQPGSASLHDPEAEEQYGEQQPSERNDPA